MGTDYGAAAQQEDEDYQRQTDRQIYKQVSFKNHRRRQTNVDSLKVGCSNSCHEGGKR